MSVFDQPETPVAPAKQRSWVARHWVAVFLVVPFGALLLCGGCCTGVLLLVFGKLKDMPPYQTALHTVQSSPEVIARIGEPIEDATWIPIGQISITNEQGQATFDFDVAGPDGQAHVHSQSRMIGGVWGLTLVEVTFADGERIALDIDDAKGIEGAPAWNPEEESPAPGPGEDIAPGETPQAGLPPVVPAPLTAAPEGLTIEFSLDTMPAVPDQFQRAAQRPGTATKR